MRLRLPVSACLLLSTICLSSIAFAQTNWQRTYGGAGADGGHSVQQTIDGGFIIAGATSSFSAGDNDVYLIKTNAQGDTLWTRTYGGPGSDQGGSVQQTTDGGYIVAGWTGSFGAGRGDFYLVKTDAQGDTLWTRVYGGPNYDWGHSVQQTTDGGYIVAGETYSFGAGRADAWLLRTDASGDTLWARTYGDQLYQMGYSVQETNDGGYIVAGFTDTVGATGLRQWLVKTDATGDTLWTRVIGGGVQY
jgi:hypothetical protein